LYDKMKVVSFYNKTTGLFNGTHFVASDDSAVEMNTPADHVAIEGHHDHLSRRVDIENPETIDVYIALDKSDTPTKVTRYNVVDYQPPPPAPSVDYEWNPQTKRWVQIRTAADRELYRRIASARIKELETSQHRLVLELLSLGNLSAIPRLRDIYDEIRRLEHLFVDERTAFGLAPPPQPLPKLDDATLSARMMELVQLRLAPQPQPQLLLPATSEVGQ
jgi:hypothetical protein